MTQEASRAALVNLLTEGRFGETVCIARQGDTLLLIRKEGGEVLTGLSPLCGRAEEPASHTAAVRLWETVQAFTAWAIARQAVPLEDLHEGEEAAPLWLRWRGSDERP